MEIVWLLGTILIIGGVTFLVLSFFNKPYPKKHKGSSFAVIDDGGAHIATTDSGHPVGEHGCDE